MNTFVNAFDQWIRGAFVEMNTELEETYFAQQDKAAVEDVGRATKKQLVEEGRGFIADLLRFRPGL